MAKNEDTRLMTPAQLKAWKPPVMSEAEQKVYAKKDPWFKAMMSATIIPFSNQLVKAAAEAKIEGKTRRKKPSKKAVKTLEKYLKANGTTPVVHEPKKRGRPPKAKVAPKKHAVKKRKK